MNSQHEEQQPPKSPQDEITRIEIEKLRLETDLIQARCSRSARARRNARGACRARASTITMLSKC